MKPSVIVLRLLFFPIFRAIVLILLLWLLRSCFVNMVKHIENHVNVNEHNLHSHLQSEIEKTTQLLNRTISFAPNLARSLSSSLDGSNFSSFSEIENKVSPFLFQALVTTPQLTRISFFGLNGLFFSYQNSITQTFALYSNSSWGTNSSNGTKINALYIQPADRNTGKLYGDAVRVTPMDPMNTIDASEFQQALNSTSKGRSFLGSTRDNARDDLMLFSMANVDDDDDGKGIISLGFELEGLVEHYTSIDLQGGGFYLTTRDEKVLVKGLQNTRMVVEADSVFFELVKPINGDQVGRSSSVPCNANNNNASLTSPLLNIEGTKYTLYCSQLDIMGVKLVYGLTLPQSELIRTLHKYKRMAQILLISIAVIMFISVLGFVRRVLNAAVVEMGLRNALNKQMEATRQAERKSINKSLAFARASHDIRAPLAGLSGLIEISYGEVARGSELETNLRQMESCTNDLLGILNSILDSSKIESGKIQLEEKEFDIAQLLEEVVDFYHPTGAEKGLDMILDPCDGSIVKFSRVKGDRAKLKQILSNLLSNSFKFTPEGHVVVRARAIEPSKKNSTMVSPNKCCRVKHLSHIFCKGKLAHEQVQEAISSVQNESNCMEFVIEVDDTGKGIPKEQQKTVFEDYVQVKDTSIGKEGTGLGLGIVQSLVRLMRGEIEIVDKDIGEKGSCFRFSVVLCVCEGVSDNSILSPDISLRSSRLDVLTPRSKAERSHVVLLIISDERRRVLKNFMESLGIKVTVVDKWKKLGPTLAKIKFNAGNEFNSSSSSGFESPCNFDVEANIDTHSGNARAVGGKAYVKSLFRRTNNYDLRHKSNFVLIVIDVTAGPTPKLRNVVSEFRNNLRNTRCRVVWLASEVSHRPNTNVDSSSQGLRFDPKNDIVQLKPFHGTRLYEVIRLLPEFGGSLRSHDRRRRANVVETEIQELGSTNSSSERPWKKMRSPRNPFHGSSCIIRSSKSSSVDHDHDHDHDQQILLQQSEVQREDYGETSEKKSLSGKRFLIIDDNDIQRIVAMKLISNLGGIVDLCTNGQTAFDLFRKELVNREKEGNSPSLPYDYILMDCELPIMSGFESARKIREEEKLYGVYVPIIGLSAHAIDSEEAKKAMEAGMDGYLCKPLKNDLLLEVIRNIHNL